MSEEKITPDPGLIYSLEETSTTPGIFLDANNGVIKISGSSFPADARGLYNPVIKFIHAHFANLETIACEMYITYLHRASRVCIPTIPCQ